MLVGALMTGPLYGWFGYRWRVDRAWTGAFAVTLAFCLEPLADLAVRPGVLTSSDVTALEVVVGVMMTLYVIVSAHRRRAAVATRLPR